MKDEELHSTLSHSIGNNARILKHQYISLREKDGAKLREVYDYISENEKRQDHLSIHEWFGMNSFSVDDISYPWFKSFMVKKSHVKMAYDIFNDLRNEFEDQLAKSEIMETFHYTYQKWKSAFENGVIVKDVKFSPKFRERAFAFLYSACDLEYKKSFSIEFEKLSLVKYLQNNKQKIM